MPMTCIVLNCGSRADRDKISFYAVPRALNYSHATHLNELSARRRQQWINAIKRGDLTESKLKYERVCSKHFIQGKPADLEDDTNPDWTPNQNMGYSRAPALKRKTDFDRMERVKKRSELKQPEKHDISRFTEEKVDESIEEVQLDTGTATQTDLTTYDLEKQSQVITFTQLKLHGLTHRLNKTLLSFESLQNDNQKCLYYTGLDFRIFKVIFEKIKSIIPTSSVSSLEPSQQFLLTLMKLRLNLHFKYLPYQFGISQTTCSSYFNVVISILYTRLKNFIIWPDRETISQNISQCFMEVFHDKTTIIIDCFEVFIQKPSSYVTQQQSWSNYKHHNTVKFLIGITPQGTISYISKAWGGRTSDKQIVERSDFLDKIEPQDVVLADRGFLIHDFLALLQAKLVIPASFATGSPRN